MRRTTRRAFPVARAGAALALLLLAGAVGATASGPDSTGKRYRDPVHKFSCSMFDSWSQIPLETKGKGLIIDPLSKFAAAKFVENDALSRRGFLASVVEVYRMTKGGKEGETTGETPGIKVVNVDEPKTMEELLKHLMSRVGATGVLDAKSAKDIKSKDGVPGRMWVMDRTNGAFMVVAMWKKDDVELGMWCACEGILRKKFDVGFSRIVSSFTWFDEKAEDVRSLDVLNGLRISARKKREIEKGLVRGWDVLVSPNKNYVVIYNTKGKRNTSLAKTLAERIEMIRAQVYESQFPPSKPVEAVSIVRICGDSLEYHAYGGPRGSAGYWSDDTEELVFFDMSPGRAVDDDTLAVLYHEAFHQFIYYSVGQVAPHSWFNEGHGDYYAGSKIADGKFTIKPFRWRIKVVKDAIKAGPAALDMTEATDDRDARFKFESDKGEYVPLKALVRFTQRDYYSYPSICYAQGWSLVYFLREIVPKNPAWNDKWGKILETYFSTLKAEVNKEKPLKPPAVAPDDPGTDEPGAGAGMDDPGMGDPGMGEPGMDDPGMSDPGMSDPGMGDPGMDDPGMGPSEPPPGDDDAPVIPQFISRFMSSSKALKKAVDAAFTGIDFDELEKAWKDSISKIPTPPPRRR